MMLKGWLFGTIVTGFGCVFRLRALSFLSQALAMS
jgi:hypothetical protein